MLQGIQPEEGDLGGVRMTVNGEDAAFVLGTMLKDGPRGQGMIHAHPTYTSSTRK
jgi:hypothetical protein